MQFSVQKDSHENSNFPHRKPHEGMWKKSEQAPPKGVSSGGCKSNFCVFMRMPQMLGLLLKPSGVSMFSSKEN